METLLSIDPDHRGTATTALRSEFFTSEPFACHPSSLPGYQLSNESNVELVQEKAGSLHILGAKEERHEYDKKGSDEVKARPFSGANAGLASSKLVTSLGNGLFGLTRTLILLRVHQLVHQAM